MKKTTNKVLSSVAWDDLTFRQRETRLRALEALSLMRQKGKSLTGASREVGISQNAFKRHVGTAVKRLGKQGKWKVTSRDRISRVMTIFSNGKRYNIETRSSATASIIGRYNSAVGHFTQTGETSNLENLKGVIVRDAAGRKYLLETRPKRVIAILERLEEPDVPTIYAI